MDLLFQFLCVINRGLALWLAVSKCFLWISIIFKIRITCCLRMRMQNGLSIWHRIICLIILNVIVPFYVWVITNIFDFSGGKGVHTSLIRRRRFDRCLVLWWCYWWTITATGHAVRVVINRRHIAKMSKISAKLTFWVIYNILLKLLKYYRSILLLNKHILLSKYTRYLCSKKQLTI